jgi:hypothetical protein
VVCKAVSILIWEYDTIKRCIMVSSCYHHIPIFSIQLSKNIQCPPETSVRSLQTKLKSKFNYKISHEPSHFFAVFLQFFVQSFCDCGKLSLNCDEKICPFYFFRLSVNSKAIRKAQIFIQTIGMTTKLERAKLKRF